MGISRIGGAASVIATLVVLPLAVTACTDEPELTTAPTSAAPPAGTEESRSLVQNYLDAMRVKDVDQGRVPLCSAMVDMFDTSATGPAGDFADHFTVPAAEIIEIRPVDGGHEVDTAVTVVAGSERERVDLVFTVVADGDGWCIADESLAESPSPATPSAPPVG